MSAPTHHSLAHYSMRMDLWDRMEDTLPRIQREMGPAFDTEEWLNELVHTALECYKLKWQMEDGEGNRQNLSLVARGQLERQNGRR